MNSAARAEAVTYRQRGWCPIPVKDRSKEPNLVELAPYLQRPATAEELRSWLWSGVSIVTGKLSGILVLDVDGPEGEEELKKHGHPGTPMVRTPSGGLHLYFKHPDTEVRTGIRVAPGLDVKANGGYVVAPPSVGPTGKAYEWVVTPDEAEPAEVRLLNLYSGSPNPLRAKAGEEILRPTLETIAAAVAEAVGIDAREGEKVLPEVQAAVRPWTPGKVVPLRLGEPA
jgi:hypothetical protein